MSQVVKVRGMTCGHCVNAVREEFAALPGVSKVEVDLVADGVSTVVVEAENALSDEQVRTALSEAGGYQLV
ncbi:MAG TPA: heavy-metal-associated domain-containing protein [Actinomycetota bacterium]|nr:heavy-metal-associated domain-containing protein [Actinomycetota bacterium]